MTEIRELTKQVRGDVFVRSPRRGGLTRVLTGIGATVLAGLGDFGGRGQYGQGDSAVHQGV